MAVAADAPYWSTRVWLYLHGVACVTQHQHAVSVLSHVAAVQCMQGVGRGAQHKVAVSLGHQAHCAIWRAEGLVLHVNSRMSHRNACSHPGPNVGNNEWSGLSATAEWLILTHLTEGHPSQQSAVSWRDGQCSGRGHSYHQCTQQQCVTLRRLHLREGWAVVSTLPLGPHDSVLLDCSTSLKRQLML